MESSSLLSHLRSLVVEDLETNRPETCFENSGASLVERLAERGFDSPCQETVQRAFRAIYTCVRTATLIDEDAVENRSAS